jgi:hypothetical protein
MWFLLLLSLLLFIGVFVIVFILASRFLYVLLHGKFDTDHNSVDRVVFSILRATHRNDKTPESCWMYASLFLFFSCSSIWGLVSVLVEVIQSGRPIHGEIDIITFVLITSCISGVLSQWTMIKMIESVYFSAMLNNRTPEEVRIQYADAIAKKSESKSRSNTGCVIVIVVLVILAFIGLSSDTKNTNTNTGTGTGRGWGNNPQPFIFKKEKPKMPIDFSWELPSWWHGDPGGNITLKNTSDKEIIVTVTIQGGKDTRKFRAILPSNTSKTYHGDEFNWIFQLGETVSVEHPDYETKGWNLAR